MRRVTSILTSRFLINLQKVEHKLADSSSLLSGEIQIWHSVSKDSRGFLDSFGGDISLDDDNIGDDGEEAMEDVTDSGICSGT